MSLAQESRDLQLKMTDELKDSKTELENVKTRLAELEKAKAELEQAKTRLAELEKANAKLEEEKAATFEIMESEKARLLDEFKEKKERAVDQAMYKIWVDNADLDTNFLGPLKAKYVERWNARLEASEAAREAAQKDIHAIHPGGSSAVDAEKAKGTTPS